MKRVLPTLVVFLSILASIVSEHGTHNAIRTPCDHNNGGCSSTCLVSTNEQGYSCACPPGIPLLSDKKTCAHGHSFLLLANGENILMISPDDSNYTVEELQLDGIHTIVDVDFDPLEGKIYWIGLFSKVIRRAYLNGSGQQDIVSTDISLPYGIAIDSIGRKLYWANWWKDRIEMSDLNGTNRKVIMRDESAKPDVIVVDTRSKRIYWTDFKNKRIESSSLDGTSRSVVIEINEGRVTSLALDADGKIIYWGYYNITKIEMANVNGSDRRVLISNDISYIFGLTVLGDYIYWTDMVKKVIERADKKTGDNRQVIFDDLYDAWRLKSIILRNVKGKDCRLDLKGKHDLTALHRNHTFEGEEAKFVHHSLVKFTCKSFYSTLEGSKTATCINGQWSKKIPKCKRTSAFDVFHPPILWAYFAKFNRINTDDGRVMIPKETLFKIGCSSPEGRQLKLTERNTAGKQFLKVNFSSEDMFYSVKVIDSVREKTEATVECVNSKGISTKFDVVIADTCEIDENELNRRGLQVVPDSRQRIYVEGDRIQVECSSNKRTTDQFIICKSGREWEYANNVDC